MGQPSENLCPAQGPAWPVCIVDDDPEVHRLSRMVLADYTFAGIPIVIHCARSVAEAKKMLSAIEDVAVVFLDVVMETDDAGLCLVHFIRKTLNNASARIVLRTGNPGVAPEETVIADYDINDYVEKADLTASRLRTLLTTSLRSFGLVTALSAANMRLATELAERRKADLALTSSREEIRRLSQMHESVIESADIWLHVLDADHRVQLWNRAAEKISGYEKGEVVGASDVWACLYPDDHVLGRLRRAVTDILGTGSAPAGDLETVICRKDGASRTISWSARPLFDKEGICWGVVSLGRDITEQKTLGLKLLQSQKMEAVGRLAGGVAHDFNNTLTVIRGYCELLNRTLEKEDLPFEKVQQIDQAAERAENLTRQLLAFSRQQQLSFQVVDLAVLVSGMEEMMTRLIPERIRLAMEMATSPLPVAVDPGRVEQVLMNLAVNAGDAMAEYGCLTIRTRRQRTGPDIPGSRGMAEGEWAVLEVADTGIGMDEATRERVFEPFFTTKEKGKGTGLGLSTVYGIVQQSKGDIRIASVPGRGTTISLFFPLSADERVCQPAKEKDLPNARGGNETILVAEDEPEVLAMISETLGLAGYRVLPARNGDSALRIGDFARKSIRLVLTDVVMPGMDGVSLAGHLAKFMDGVPVIFMSGYADPETNLKTPLAEHHAFLQKPFTAQKLLRLIRRLLDASVHLSKDMPG